MSKPDDSKTPLKLHIDAHALLQLGEQLITDDAQAILELVKNCYDADSQWAKIRIDSHYVPGPKDPAPSTALGLIEVEDNGSGMDLAALRDSWLRISFSFKRNQKRLFKVSPRFKRLPIGDKGLGRLGTMRLGSHLSVETRTSPGKPGWLVTFQWSDIQGGQPLENVPIATKAIPANGETGTIVRIFGLRDASTWKSQNRVRDLQTKLCGLVSPFHAFKHFDVTLQVDKTSVQLARITESLRSSSTVRFDYTWDGNALRIEGKVKLAWFRKEAEEYDRFIAKDSGRALSNRLLEIPKLRKEFGLALAAEKGWYVCVSKCIASEDFTVDGGFEADPGPFSGSLDYFDLGGLTELPKVFADKAASYRNLVKELAAIYIYRDGFGVGMNRDWLNLGGAWTTASGYYSLKPNNVIGYFAISVKDNTELIEKSDREGFVDNPEWRGFECLAREVIGIANGVLNAMGRGAVKFIKESKGDHPSDEAMENYGSLLATLEEILRSSRALDKHFKQNAELRRNALRKVAGAARMLWVNASLPKAQRDQAKSFLDNADKLVNELVEDQETVAGLTQKLVKEEELGRLVRRKMDDFEERTQLLSDMVAVGLSAQVLAHDVPAMLTQIGDHSKALIQVSKARDIEAALVKSHGESIASTVEAITEMIDFVQPMLRGKRLSKQKAPLSEFLNNFYTLRGARLRSRNIHWHVEDRGQVDFKISFNAGRFIQILDNLTTNSEYWIRHKHGDKRKGRIDLAIVDPELIFWDNGPGIRPDLEETLFELFTSGKPTDEGNGLGLFIAQQLLLRDNCSISLAPDRNAEQRLFKFVINFSGAKTK